MQRAEQSARREGDTDHQTILEDRATAGGTPNYAAFGAPFVGGLADVFPPNMNPHTMMMAMRMFFTSFATPNPMVAAAQTALAVEPTAEIEKMVRDNI